MALGARPAGKTPSLTSDVGAIDSAVGQGTAYPAQVAVVAFNGSIAGVANTSGATPTLTLFPSASGSLQLLADDNVSGLNIAVSDRAPANVASWDKKSNTSNPISAGRSEQPTDARIVTRVAGTLLEVQALRGDIKNSTLDLPAQSLVRAGRDISGVGLALQNLNTSDISTVVADTGDVRPDGTGLNIGGPGRLLVQAGRNAELQTTAQAVGNGLNSSLASAQSARLTVVAGVSGPLALDKLDAAYAELIAAGSKQDKTRADAAIKNLFTGTTQQAGDINSFLSSVQTTGGSDVDLLAPQGNITVGLTSTPPGTTVGAVTNAGGAIRSYLKSDFNINSGKVVTAQGGDILIYTADGNIDAGRGAKTSVTTPAPRRVPKVDKDGVVTGYSYVLSSGVAGSGIQTVTSDPDGPGPLQAGRAGDVYLFAPKGFVDAGEAGIVSGANIVIAAQVVLNAANISAAGSAQGVPVVSSGSLASSLAAGGAPSGGSNKAAEDAAAAATNAAKAAAAAGNLAKPAILTVEVLGFGDKNCKENQKDCFAK